MKIIKHSEVPVNPNAHGVDARMMFGNDKIKVVIGTLQPGESIDKHPIDSDAIFYVVEGRGTFMLGDEEQEVIANTIIESPAFIPKGWKNNSDSILRFMAVKF